jgi:hypothetical protein
VPQTLRAINAFTRVFDALWRCAADPGAIPAPRHLAFISEFQKFHLTSDPNHFYIPAVPSHREGRHAIVTAAGRDAVDADAPITNGAEADGEDVWS